MNDVKSYILLFILILAFAAGCFYLGNVYAKYNIKVQTIKSDTTYITNTIVKADTIKKWFPKYVYKDTLKIEKLDTILISDRDTFKLNLERLEYPSPNYTLSYDWKKYSETKVITNNNIIETKESFLSNFSLGIGIGYSAYLQEQNVKITPSINLSLYYKLF